MAVEFKLPELGENIETCDVVEVLVSEGDAIQEGQPVLEIETDKAAVEVPSETSGVVAKIHVKAGDTIKVGQTLLTVETDEAAGAKEKPEKPARKAAEKVVPQGQFSLPKSQAPLQRPEIAAARTQPAARPTQPMQQAESIEEELLRPKPSQKVAPAAPSVRQFAREIGVDINQVAGTGPGGRISMDDVKNYARQLRAGQPSAEKVVPQGQFSLPAAKAASGVSLPDFSKWGETEREAMSGVRRATATHMSAAWSSIPHVTNFDKADITELEKLRKEFQPKAEAAGGKLTITAILLKVVVGALKAFPKFNSSVAMNSHEIIYKKYYNIGVAVDTPAGLLVPVIRDVDRKSIIELAVELGQVAEKARNRELSLEDIQGGAFTLTNLGGIGGTHFTPIINAPEVAILGVARGRYEPVWTGEEFQPRLMLPLALSYDHRVIDGADAARFLRWLVETLEQPFLIALQG